MLGGALERVESAISSLASGWQTCAPSCIRVDISTVQSNSYDRRAGQGVLFAHGVGRLHGCPRNFWEIFRTIAQKYNVILAGAPDLEIEITSEMVEAGA
jgi:hypothetical protein